MKVESEIISRLAKLRHLSFVRRILRFLTGVILILAPLSGHAAHTQAKLLLGAESARPGETVLAGIQLRMEGRWHTYWRNSGASGMATKVEWQLPAGITAGAIQWPLPDKLPEQDLTTYVYTNEVVLLVPLKIAPDVASGRLKVQAKVSWLECDLQCVPGKAELEGFLNIRSETKPSADATILAAWQKKVPQDGTSLAARAWWEKPASGDTRPLILEWNSSKPTSDADFFPDGYEKFEVQGETERLPAENGKIALRKQVKKFEGDWPTEISGVVVQESGNQRVGYEIKVPCMSSRPSMAAPVSSPEARASQPLWKFLAYAFLGGLILNVMPCVLPVISLKILGFVAQSRDEPRRVRLLGILYALGVLVSFLAFGAIIIGLRAAGHRVAWGMQFANPEFLVALTTIVTLVALNLFGVFEINPGQGVMGTAGALASKKGRLGAFFNGALATVLATPCTAPFFGAAAGFAITPWQSPSVILLIFVVAAMGLAFPYLALSLQPAWLKYLPKPGPWMQRFKVAMGFPMLATAVWLLSLTPAHYGNRTLWLGIFLVALGLAAWIYGEFVQRSRSRPWLGASTALLVLFAGYYYALERQLDWRSFRAEAPKTSSAKESSGGIDWSPWSLQAIAQARAEGHPVLVDFTADWCLTCQANKKFAIETPSVTQKLHDINAVTLVADYTRVPGDMTSELNRYGRAGVPLVLVYPKEPDASPIVLPEALTPGIVLDALEKAAR
jgi:thiol:disulfide interchange protein DsbD